MRRNPSNGDRLHIASAAEAASLAGMGWEREGVAFWGSPDVAPDAPPSTWAASGASEWHTWQGHGGGLRLAA